MNEAQSASQNQGNPTRKALTCCSWAFEITRKDGSEQEGVVPSREPDHENESEYGQQLSYKDTHLWSLYAKMLVDFFSYNLNGLGGNAEQCG